MIVAVEEAVQVALVSGLLMGSVPAAIGAVVAHRTNRRTAAKLDDKIGTPNGQGNVVEMLERILAGQAGQDNRIARLEGRQHEHGVTLVDHGGQLARLDGRVHTLEATRPS